jgi:hypothetical protein
MTSRRGFLILAILTALLGAPSAALAAPPNVLTAPVVTPAAGTTATTFSLSVQYVSVAGNPATDVTASIGGRSLVMWLAAGTATGGTWTVSTTLPVGTWPVIFRAAAARGPQPTVNGPTVVVLAAPAPVTTAAPSVRAPTPTPSRQASIVDGSGDTSTASAVPANPAVAPDPTDSPAAEARPSTGAAPVEPAPAASAGMLAPAAEPVATTLPGTAGMDSTPAPGAMTSGTPDPGSLSPVGRARSSEGLLGDASSTTWAIMVVGLVGVAVVALAGTGWLLLGSRRRRGDPMVTVTAAPAPATLPPSGESTDQLLSRRSRQRARIRATDDPVLASMGLDEPAEGRPRGSQVHRGAGTRDVSRRRPRG